MATKTVIGLEGVVKALNEVPKEARSVLRDAIAVSTRVLTQRTKQAAPFETGALREAIVDAPPRRADGKVVNGYVKILPAEFRGRVPSEYVTDLEYGKGPGARTFIRSTAEAESAGFVNRIRDSGKQLERNLENIGGRNL